MIRDRKPSKTYAQIYRIVRRIPKGRVATYGQIARLAGLHNSARQVGYALYFLDESCGVPWHRVVNAQGRISALPHFGSREIQRLRLEEEGIVFGEDDSIDLDRFRWRPRRV